MQNNKEAPEQTMAYKHGDLVRVNLDQLTSVPAHVKGSMTEVGGRILQRCGPAHYDVLLEKPLSSELTLLSWVPEELLHPDQ